MNLTAKYILPKLVTLLLILLLTSCKKEPAASRTVTQVDQLVALSIHTKNSEKIKSRNEYITGTIGVISGDGEDGSFADLEIRGRGNSTWKFPKKSYQIKFDKKEKMLGMPEGKRWVLLANYSDKTLLRNELGFSLGRLSKLDFTPESRLIELYVNDEYLGIYQIAQKVEQSSNRVDIGDDGFLLEVDQLSQIDPDDIYFKVGNYLFNIKEPKLSFEDARYAAIKDYITLTNSVLLGDNFRDPDEGYAKYIDVESFIDWYLINEITKNNDAVFFTSVYMNYVPGGKLKMGPIWDFDISLGNINYNDCEKTDGFHVTKTKWVARLFKDPEFVAKVKTRFKYFRSNQDLVIKEIKSKALSMDKAIERNFSKWEILGTYVWPNNVHPPTYKEELNYLETWLDKRFTWLDSALNDL